MCGVGGGERRSGSAGEAAAGVFDREDARVRRVHGSGPRPGRRVRAGGVGPQTGSEPGRARAPQAGFSRGRAKRDVGQVRSKAAPLRSGRARPASSYPAALAGRAPDHDALFAGAEWGAKGAGPILTAAYCSRSPARHPAHLGRFADVSIALSPDSSFLVVSRRIAFR
jgi:hypothetical protein